jgi:hypothetical protein
VSGWFFFVLGIVCGDTNDGGGDTNDGEKVLPDFGVFLPCNLLIVNCLPFFFVLLIFSFECWFSTTPEVANDGV